MKKSLLVLVGFMMLVLISCSARYNTVQPVGIKNLELEPLTSSQYEIVKNVSGTATVKTFLMFRIEGYNKSGFLSSNLTSQSTIDLAKSNAIYNAINNNSDIDAMLCPKFTKEVSGIPFLYTETTVSVTGKGIKIK